jgi:hypothetical protein
MAEFSPCMGLQRMPPTTYRRCAGGLPARAELDLSDSGDIGVNLLVGYKASYPFCKNATTSLATLCAAARSVLGSEMAPTAGWPPPP